MICFIKLQVVARPCRINKKVLILDFPSLVVIHRTLKGLFSEGEQTFLLIQITSQFNTWG